MADVKWTFFADTAAAERAIQQLEQKFHKLENAQEQMARKSRAAAGDSEAAFMKMTTKVASYAAGLASIPALMASIGNAQSNLVDEQDALGARLEDNIKKFRVLSGLDAIQSTKAKEGIQAAAQIVGISEQQAWDASQQMVSSGFDASVATGTGLLEFLKVQAASNETDVKVDSQELARAMASYLNSQQMPLNAENVAKVGVGVQRLFKATDMGLPDLEHIAKIGAVMKGKLSTEEQFAAMSVLRTEGALPGPEAATSLRNIPMFLATASSEKKKTEALAALSLTPDQVDLTGESFTDVLGLMGEKLKGAQPKARAPILKDLFGVESVAQFQTLVDNLAPFQERQKIQADTTGFNQDLDISTSGPNASKVRMGISIDKKKAEKAQRFDVYKTGIDEATEDSLPAWMLARSMYGVGSMVPGMDPKWLMQWSLGGQGMPRAEAARKSVEEAYLPASQQTRLLEEMTKSNRELVELQKRQLEEQKKNKPALNRNAQGEGAPQ